LTLASSQTLSLLNNGGASVTYKSEVKVMTYDSNNLKALKPDAIPNKCFLKPAKWNEACFDLIFVKNKHEITFFQITRNEKKHKYNLSYVANFITSVYGDGTRVVNFRVVVPDYIKKTFKVTKFHFSNVDKLAAIDARWNDIDQVLKEQKKDMKTNAMNVPQSLDHNESDDADQVNSPLCKILYSRKN
jgi:hypothetical protein